MKQAGGRNDARVRVAPTDALGFSLHSSPKDNMSGGFTEEEDLAPPSHPGVLLHPRHSLLLVTSGVVRTSVAWLFGPGTTVTAGLTVILVSQCQCQASKWTVQYQSIIQMFILIFYVKNHSPPSGNERLFIYSSLPEDIFHMLVRSAALRAERATLKGSSGKMEKIQ